MTDYTFLRNLALLEYGQDGLVRVNAAIQSFDAALTPSKEVRIFDHFTGGIGSASPIFAANSTNSGTVATAGINGITSRPGICELGTSTTNNATAYVGTQATSLVLAGGILTIETLIQIPTLSNGTETFTVRVGAGDSRSAEPTRGAYFRYTHGVNSGKFQTVSRLASTETANDSGVAPVAGTWYNLKLIFNAAGTSCDYYIDHTLVGTHTTNLDNTNVVGAGVGLVKSAGTTARQVNVDYLFIHQILP